MQHRLAAIAALPLFLLAACSSPRERGEALGAQHADQLSDGDITFAELTRELDEADRGDDADERREFDRGYWHGIAPARTELVRLMVREVTLDGIAQLSGAAAEIAQVVRGPCGARRGSLDQPAVGCSRGALVHGSSGSAG